MARQKAEVAETTTVEVNRPERPRRVPVSGPRDILTVMDQDPNYVYRWVNDTDGRLDRFKLGGWEVVTGKHTVGMDSINSGSNKYGSAHAKQIGGGNWAVLMRIPKEYYDEDQKAKQDRIDEIEATMREEGRKEGRYGDVVIQTPNRR